MAAAFSTRLTFSTSQPNAAAYTAFATASRPEAAASGDSGTLTYSSDSSNATGIHNDAARISTD
jgi:hypothetical protein